MISRHAQQEAQEEVLSAGMRGRRLKTWAGRTCPLRAGRRLGRGLLVGLFAVGLVWGGASESWADGSGPRVIYDGKMQNAQGRPIGGVYPLTFSIYRGARGGRAVWSETHYVAIDNGVYAVELGLEKPIPKSVNLNTAYLGVALKGGKELLREKLKKEPLEKDTRPKYAAGDGAAPQPAQGSYADFAGYADEAGTAKDAETLGGMSLDELRTLIRRAGEELRGRGASVTIGDNKRFSSSAGGNGGFAFTLECPPGFVVTGLRGRAGNLVDQVSAICSPLE